MRCKVKWRANGEEPLEPEIFDNYDLAKARSRELLAKHGLRIAIDVWNEDETWQIVSATGITAWCGED